MNEKRVIIGIDPGLATIGFAVLIDDGDKGDIQQFGVITTDAGLEITERLVIIAEDLQSLIDLHHPTEALVEELFFAKNTKTAIDVAQARGVLLQILAKNGIQVRQITPNQVKVAVCGDGAADKIQIQEFVTKIYGLSDVPQPDDAADALAIAFAGLQTPIPING